MLVPVWWSRTAVIHYNIMGPGKSITTYVYISTRLTKWWVHVQVNGCSLASVIHLGLMSIVILMHLQDWMLDSVTLRMLKYYTKQRYTSYRKWTWKQSVTYRIHYALYQLNLTFSRDKTTFCNEKPFNSEVDAKAAFCVFISPPEFVAPSIN